MLSTSLSTNGLNRSPDADQQEGLTGIPQAERITAAPETQQPRRWLQPLNKFFDKTSHPKKIMVRPILLISRITIFQRATSLASCVKSTGDVEECQKTDTHSSLTLSSSLGGKRGRTKENREVERSLRKRRCNTPGCILVELRIAGVLRQYDSADELPGSRVSLEYEQKTERGKGVWKGGWKLPSAVWIQTA